MDDADVTLHKYVEGSDTAETVTGKVLQPDGTGGVEWNTVALNGTVRDPDELERVDTGAWEVPTTGVDYFSPNQLDAPGEKVIRRYYSGTGSTASFLALDTSVSNVEAMVDCGGWLEDVSTGDTINVESYSTSAVRANIEHQGGVNIALRRGTDFVDTADTWDVWVDLIYITPPTSSPTPRWAGVGTNIDEGSTAETGTTKFLAPDGTGGVEWIEQQKISKTITIESPALNDDITFFRIDVAITVQEIYAVCVDAGTPDVDVTIRHATDRSAAGTIVVEIDEATAAPDSLTLDVRFTQD
jgi:hypothetical protein